MMTREEKIRMLPKIRRLHEIYLTWCKLTDRFIVSTSFRTFVFGQPWSYWE